MTVDLADVLGSQWVGLSISYSLLVTAFVELFQGAITSHHAMIVFLLALLPYVGTLAGLTSLDACKFMDVSPVVSY